MRTRRVAMVAALASTALLLAAGKSAPLRTAGAPGAAPPSLLDSSDGSNWAGPGRTFGEQHFSPLQQINDRNVASLRLAWAMDLPEGNSVTQPLAVNGILYMATGYSVVRAIDARTGRQLWVYDPRTPEVLGRKLRLAWGSRGLAWWNGKLYVGTQDGRLIAINAATGKRIWSVMTVGEADGRYITGAPRVFDGKVVIGHGGADVANVRGYVTTYDAETGKRLWRFYTVPGNPADGFESKAMEMAARTWSGKWWEFGGGGTVWNAMAYDPETDTLFLGTGNGAPWNHRIRSEGKGDNLFLCSIVALDAKTGAYKWHYQINPAESWDYNASMDVQLADLTIAGVPRKVLLTTPKNGFFYVIDRVTGQFISAEPYTKVTWATGIDQKTGRPIDAPNNRYQNGPFLLAPSPSGGHSWLSMAFSPKSGLAYVPELELEALYDQSGVDTATWKRAPGFAFNGGVNLTMRLQHPGAASNSSLVAWNPVTQKQAWRVPTPSTNSGGVVATAGNLVFQGQLDGRFNAYDATNGKRLWSFDAGAPVMAPPITYTIGGRQYLTVLSGAGTSLVVLSEDLQRFNIDYRDQKRRVLTFAISGKAKLEKSPPFKFQAIDDRTYRPDEAAETRGARVAGGSCMMCHGVSMIGAGLAPDLRMSPYILDKEAFASVVRDGALVSNGMPRFDDLPEPTREDVRQYLRSVAHQARAKRAGGK